MNTPCFQSSFPVVPQGYTEITLVPVTKDLKTIHLHSRECSQYTFFFLFISTDISKLFILLPWPPIPPSLSTTTPYHTCPYPTPMTVIITSNSSGSCILRLLKEMKESFLSPFRGKFQSGSRVTLCWVLRVKVRHELLCST